MRLIETKYIPNFMVSFTKAEVLEFQRLAKRHYDPYCKSMAEQGGLIFEMMSRVMDEDICELEISQSNAGLLAKVIESECFGPMAQIYDSLISMLRVTTKVFRVL